MIECPFLDIMEYHIEPKCVYLDEKVCDFDIGPGNGDSFCRENIEKALEEAEAV